MNKFIKKYRILIGIYLIWFLLNMLLLNISGYNSRFDEYFFPFDGDLSNYHQSEFIFYTITPILLFCIYLCFRMELRKIELKKILIPIVTYIIWVSVQFKLLSLSGNLKMDEYFFPFTKSKYYSFAELKYYNISEFIVYTFVPVILFVSYLIFIKKKKRQK